MCRLATEAVRAAALPIIERTPAAALLMAISWPWPRDICLLLSQSELVALDLNIELDHIDVVSITGLGIFVTTRLCLDLVEIDAELASYLDVSLPGLETVADLSVTTICSCVTTFTGNEMGVPIRRRPAACLAVLEVDIDVLHPLGFSSTHAFAVHLHSLATELEVLRRILVRLCSLASELEVLARIAVLLLGRALLLVFSEP